ncbi:hypothetical protein NL868_001316 [Shigella flexneri]|nr:hypothetical protein [Shigella flexneri]
MITLHQDCKVYQIKKNYKGIPSKVDEQDAKCRSKEKYQIVVNQNAEKVTSSIEFTMKPETRVEVGYHVFFNEKEYPVIAVNLTRNTLGEIVKKAVFV